jgi:hypothetical protein
MKSASGLPKSALVLLAACRAAERSGRPIDPSRIDPNDARHLVDNDLARRDGAALVLTDAGRARLMRQAADGDETGAFRAQHLDLVRRMIRTDDGALEALIDESESPLRKLAKRKGKGGVPLITSVQEQAGERLRLDFTRAQLTPRVTATWDGTIAQGRRGQGGGTFSDLVVAAGQRVRHALEEVGPEFAGLLLDVCCFLKGLEEVERERRWPQRSAKIVVQLALDRLARHYGLTSEARGRARMPIRRWSEEGGARAV